MKKTIKILWLLFVTSLLSSFSRAQQFKWVRGGGSIYDFSSAGSSEFEQVKKMCTDPNGNIYVLSQVGNDPITADTFHATPYGANDNILITSYNCNGQMRWAKLIASSGGTCIPFGVIADSLGHIYLAGAFMGAGAGGTFHIGNDTTISSAATAHLATGLIQFDTTGDYKWIRYIGPNTFAGEIATAGGPAPITIDGVNNVHYFVYVSASGIPLTTSVTSIYGVYDFIYDLAGTLLGAVRLDLDSQWYLRGVVIDPTTNKLYTYGEVNQSFGAGVDTFFAAAFDASRNKLWQYFAGHGGDNGFSGIVLDKNKHLHFCGATQSSTFSFNGDSVSSSHFGGNMSVIVTTDTNGHVEWFRNFESTLSVNDFSSIALLPNNKVVAIGTFAGEVLDEGGANIVTPSGMGWLPYFAIVDSAGDLQILKCSYADGFYNEGTAAVADKEGNIYIGGFVEDSVYFSIPAIPAYHTIGGNTDYFVMKYGVECSCTYFPTASYTDTGTHTIGFTYTGTTTGIDSVIWNFGDGNIGSGTNPFHTYTASGTYHACATVYTDCGSDIHCSDVVVVVCTAPVASFSDTGSHTFGFAYTGTTSGLDSVVWNFGDGNSSTGITPLHTYTASGTYTVCVTAYTACGSDSSCSTVVVSTTGVSGFCLNSIYSYPNPVKDELHILGVPPDASFRLLNVTSECVIQGNLKAGNNTIPTNTLSAGLYILEIARKDGIRNMVRIIKG